MFTDIIEKLCDEKNITIAKMLRDLDLASSIFNKWKFRGSFPSIETVKKIAEYFDASIDYLVSEQKEIFSPQLSLPKINLKNF